MKKAFVYSLKHSLPIFVSFVPVGLVYGILMCTAGYNWLWSGFCSIAVTVGLHLWKKNSLISILGGTVCCMILTQMMV